MKDYKKYFKDKKITVIGLGLLGRGVGDVKFLAECGADLIVTDLKSESELAPSLEKLKRFKNIKFVLGQHDLGDFKDRDLIIKAAGIPLDSPFIAEARKNKIPVKMSTALFAELSGIKIVGITGTRGKSTVAAMVTAILETAHKKVFLGGNIKGVSTLAHLSEVSGDEIVVLELDSWQLQGFGEEKISPNVAVFTTFFPDHLNYYKNNLDLYLNDKTNIFRFQKEENFLILGDQVAPTILSKFEKDIKSNILIVETKKWNLKIPGEHNLYNASLAAKAAEVLGISEETIKGALEKFDGVEGRLELVKEFEGIKIYNDTTSTTPSSTIMALKALGSVKKDIVLIMGGNDKELEINELLDLIPNFCKAVVILEGTGSDRLPEEIGGLKPIRVKNLKESLDESLNVAKKGDIILFSPAFTSFGQFKNEFDRGEQFVVLVEKL